MSWGPNAEYRYGESGRKGDLGEDFVKQYLSENNIPFEDKQDYHSQVIAKIDLIVDGVPVDVKTNAFKDFLCVEVERANGRAGWLYRTTAEEIYGVDLNAEEIYRYNVEDMIEYVTRNEHRIKSTKFNDKVIWVPKGLSIIERLL